jgi:benzoyl-CoA reductase/2-hydroxyglutaryl-CoA dehydratase subunit BcrC/BadD/HgdB
MALRSLSDPRIGITATVPSEVIFAAGLVPVDLNNLFITAHRPAELLEEAERAGFPRNCCAWIKGIYSACRRSGLRRLVGVTRGDCSNTLALMEILRSEGIETVEFAYPLERKPELVAAALADFAYRLGTTKEAAEDWRRRLEPARRQLAELDRLAWQTGQVTPAEAHFWMVSSSDFRGCPDTFCADLESFLQTCRDRPLPSPTLAVALAGVPTIKTDLFDHLTRLGARVVHNEMAFEFTMARSTLHTQCLENIYYNYSYPYDIIYRTELLSSEVRRRSARGVIHYVQSFCYRQIQDRLLREALPVPVLTLECDRPGHLDAGAVTRLEAFVESLRAAEVCR